MPNIAKPGTQFGYEAPVHKYGHNPEIDTGVQADVWSVGGEYPFPESALETTVVSDSADDGVGGAGAQTIVWITLDEDCMKSEQPIVMNGLTPVVLPIDAYRTPRGYVELKGSNGTNVGNIKIKHGAVVIGQIDAGAGQTQMAITTIPADYAAGWLVKTRANVRKTITSVAEVVLQFRLEGKAWREMDLLSASNVKGDEVEYPGWIEFPPKTDFRLRGKSVSANNTPVYGSFDIFLEKKE